MRFFYVFILVVLIAILAATIIHYSFNVENQLSIPRIVSFSGALQWVIAGGYFLTFLGMFMFGPIIISAAAFASALGYLNVWIIFAIAVFGDLGMDLILYAIGYFGRIGIVEKYGHRFGLSYNRMKKIENLIHSHPGKTLAAIKLAPFLPIPGLMLVGSTHMSAKKFTFINFLIALPKAVVFMAIGYYFGQIYDSLSRYVKNTEYVLLASVIAIFGIYYIYKKIMGKVVNEDIAPQAARYRNPSEANHPSLKLRKGSPRHLSSRQAAKYSGEGE